MADSGAPSSQTITRKGLQNYETSSEPHGYNHDEHKENVVQGKQSSAATTAASGRIHGEPMSPVKLNVQSEKWAVQSSSPQYDRGKSSIRQVEDMNSTSQQERNRVNNDSEEAIVHDITCRQNYTTHTAESLQQPHAAVFSSVESAQSHSEDSQEYGHGSRNTSSPSLDSAADAAAAPVMERLHYHHQEDPEDLCPRVIPAADVGTDINRHLTPTSTYGRRSAIPRPASAYSAFSDPDPRGRSPGHNSQSPSWAARSPSANLAGRSPDGGRPSSYIDLLNVPYPQPPPPAISFDNSQLRTAVGSNASLLSTAKTLEMYRLNVKKTNDPSIRYAFAVFLIAAAQEAGLNESASTSRKLTRASTARDLDNPPVETVNSPSSAQDLLREARQILQGLADRSYPFAQYYLADGYASGLFNKGKEDYDRAFPLFVAASKHGHAESGYRAALCYEFGWGCRKDPAKAVQFYRQSASKNHPGAMTRLGRACLSGDLGLNKYKEGIKWLKRATDAADPQYNAAPYHLGLLYETGYGDDIFQDETYAAQLFTQAADLGHAEASYRLGDAYEHGKLSCPRDPALSVHFYTGAAQNGHPAAMMALCAWYMVGAEPILEKDENEAYEWAWRAAELGKPTYRSIRTPRRC